MHFKLADPSAPTDREALPCMLFYKLRSQFPPVERTGEIVLIRRLKVRACVRAGARCAS